MQPLRIGINALFMIPGGVGGTEIYLRSLLLALGAIDNRNHYFVFLNLETDRDFVPPSQQFQVVRCHVRARSRVFRILYEQTRLPMLLARHRIDVVLNPGFTSPALARCPSVTVVHDLQYVRHPEYFRPLDLPFWRVLVWLSAKRARRLIAISQSTAYDLCSHWPDLAHKIEIIPHGVEEVFFQIAQRRSANPPGRHSYILCVSTLHPHKNLDRLLEAVNASGQRLVVAGLHGLAAERLRQQARKLHLGDRVTFTGWIPRAELHRLFEQASAFIAPSLFEGFGLPLLEALAAGLPTACSAIPVFDEVAGTAALRFDPFSVSQITQALRRIEHDDKFRELSATDGPARASQFSWQTAAEKTLRVLTLAAGCPDTRT